MDLKPKRIKHELKKEQKKKICDFHISNPKTSQKDLREKFSTEFNMRIPASTMSDIIKNKEIYRNDEDSYEFRNRDALHPQLEEALHLWFCELRVNKIPVSDQMLIHK
ncbi:tigger transposable element-derived 6-like, partial [Brachionus plicatilis]